MIHEENTKFEERLIEGALEEGLTEDQINDLIVKAYELTECAEERDYDR